MTDASSQLLAEVEIFHSRTQSPTRRLSLGNLVLPVTGPGLGGCCWVNHRGHLHEVDEELVPDVHRLVLQVDRGDRVVQPRLLHRYQIDRQGLSRSRHRLVGDGEQLSYEFESNAAHCNRCWVPSIRSSGSTCWFATCSRPCCTRPCAGEARSTPPFSHTWRVPPRRRSRR